MVALRKLAPEPEPYTLRMGMAEEQIFTTIMVMVQVGEEKEIWNVCSNMCAARGLTESQSRRVVAVATERAKRQMRY